MKPDYLYIHVPFCARRCGYCDFAVQAVRNPPVSAWLDAVEAELELVAAAEGWAGPLELETIYVGGGTPSLLGGDAMLSLRRRLERFARLADGVEWTAEANPESFGEAVATGWREAGVNRVSLGAQSFHAPSLSWMGRLHGPEGPGAAVAAARAAGIGNVSVDLIFGLPSRLGRDWSADLERVVALEPEHVSLYGLTAEPGAPLGRRVAEGRERLPDEDAYEAEFLEAAERLAAAGYRHYEVSNFARPGRESRHNGAYWTGAAYLGLGSGAHSYQPPVRRWNLREWPAYLAEVRAGRRPVGGEERLDEAALRLERVWLALRTAEGLPEAGWTPEQARLAEAWRRAGWAEVRGGVLRLTPRGWLLLDRLAVEFDAAGEGRDDGGTGGVRLDAASAGRAHSESTGIPMPG